MADTQPVSPVAHGAGRFFAGALLMIIGGAFQALEALAAIVQRQVPRGPPAVRLRL